MEYFEIILAAMFTLAILAILGGYAASQAEKNEDEMKRFYNRWRK